MTVGEARVEPPRRKAVREEPREDVFRVVTTMPVRLARFRRRIGGRADPICGWIGRHEDAEPVVSVATDTVAGVDLNPQCESEIYVKR